MQKSDLNQELLNIFEEMRDKIESSQNTITPGVFCDIAGTLLNYNAQNGETEVNQNILEYLRAQKSAGKPVTLVSIVENNALISGTGLEQEFGPVHSKAIYRNSTVEILIDDNPTQDALVIFDPASYKDMELIRLQTQKLNNNCEGYTP